MYLPDGERAPIEHLSVNEAQITLGMSSCPSGVADNVLGKEKDKAALSELGEMSEKAMKWANEAAKSHLCPRDIHSASTASSGRSSIMAYVPTAPPMTN